MNDLKPRVDPIVFLTAALGGRPIYAFAWGLWLFIAVVVTTGADLLQSDSHSSRTISAFSVGIVGLLIIGSRLVLIWTCKGQRNVLFSIDPRCAAQTVSGFSRLAIKSVPLLALLAMVAVWKWR